MSEILRIVGPHYFLRPNQTPEETLIEKGNYRNSSITPNGAHATGFNEGIQWVWLCVLMSEATAQAILANLESICMCAATRRHGLFFGVQCPYLHPNHVDQNGIGIVFLDPWQQEGEKKVLVISRHAKGQDLTTLHFDGNFAQGLLFAALEVRK